jgi:hypothetical protein
MQRRGRLSNGEVCPGCLAIELVGSDKTADNLTQEAATAKLWAVYVSEAEKYDKSLVESWKSDMEAMLIFVCG